MKQLAKFSVDRAITVFMAVFIVIIFGVVSFTNLTTDLFPSLNIPYSVVLTTYPGASPIEVEDQITTPLEETLATTTNIKELQSISQENVSIIILEFNTDTNMDSAVIEMRESLDLLGSSLPEMAGDPMIIKLNPDLLPIMQVSVTKEGFTQHELTQYVETEILPQLERVAGVASVSVSGAYESEIQVVLDEAAIAIVNDNLEQVYDDLGVPSANQLLLDKELISNLLMAQNFEFPVGYANVEGIDYLVRVGDEFDSLQGVKDLLIFNVSGLPGLDPIQLSVDDIAEVTFVNANDKEYSKVNGENAISISIQKNSEFATTDVTDELNAVMATLMEGDENLAFTVLLDQGEYINQATGNVLENLLYGAILAIIVLIVFLRSARATLTVAVAIPISLMFAIVLIYFTGITLNIVSLAGLALGLGMLVDNSIVVIENIFRMKKEGRSNRDAAIEGTKQVASAITASTITTISVFLPVVFIEGFIREIFFEMAMTIAYSLSASLIIALTLVPAISSKVFKDDEGQTKTQDDGEPWYKRAYEATFRFAMKWRFIVLGAVLLLFGGAIALALTNGFEYFPPSDEGQLTVSISNPTDAPLSYDEFVTRLDNISTDFLALEDVEVVGISLGSLQGMMFGLSSGNNATANVVLREDRTNTTLEMQAILEDLLDDEYADIDYDITGAQQETDILTGSGLQVRITGYDLDTLKQKAEELTALIEAVEGVEAVDSGIGVPADEIKITVDKAAAMSFGLTTAQVTGTVAEFLAGEDVTTTLNIEGDLYDLYVYDSDSNYGDTEYTLADLENLVIGLNFLDPSELIRVRDVATVQTIEGFSSIDHFNGVRSVTVSAEFDEDYNSTFVARDIEAAIADFELPDGYQQELLGENEEIMEALSTMILATILGVILIYMVMAAQFQNLTYPFIIMITLPLAFTGGFLILFFAGMTVSVVAAIGFVVLTGVVVNNGIVLVDYTNQLREQGLEVFDALLEAGKTRLRPIIMTASTTILALSTMAIGVGQGAEIIQPMAVTTIGGLFYATILTLLVVPIMYLILTRHAKPIMLSAGILFTIAGGIGAYLYFGFTWILPTAGVLLIPLIAGYFIRGNGGEARV